jgi:hypothetical protein
VVGRGVYHSLVCQCLRCRVPNTGWARADSLVSGPASCVRKSLDHMLQTRWPQGTEGRACQGGSPSISPVTSPRHRPLRRQGSRCKPGYHVEHSPQSRWIVGAAGLNRRPIVRRGLDPQSKEISQPYMRPMLRSKAYRCRLESIFLYLCTRILHIYPMPVLRC